MDDARHFFPFLPVAFALGIAIYFVWPSEPGFYYLAVLPILLAVWRVPSLHTEAGNYNAYINSGIIFFLCRFATMSELRACHTKAIQSGARFVRAFDANRPLEKRRARSPEVV